MSDLEIAERWGVQTHFADTSGVERKASGAAIDAVLGQLREGDSGESPVPGDEMVFSEDGEIALELGLQGRRLVTEPGDDLGSVSALPADLPTGYHQLINDDTGSVSTLVVHPRSCYLPDDLRGWGWALQLPADRSRQSWGIGDFADARLLGDWCHSQGGRPQLLLSPVHAPNLTDQPQDSPYFASSRCFGNPLLLRVEEVDGAASLGDGLAEAATAGRALNNDRRIDRAAVWGLKRAALEQIWTGAGNEKRRAEVNAVLTGDKCAAAFAAFAVASEQHGPAWSSWPADLHHPNGSGWAELRVTRGDRIAFHGWLQGQIQNQLMTLDRSVPVLQDLAIGTDREGFDAWYWQDLFVLDGTRIGAPPDQFNTLGQDWGLPPLNPWRLRSAGYEPFLRMLRAAFSTGSGLRMDHVMGLFRLFWIPAGFDATAGVYVRQRSAEFLALLALESSRAKAFVVGEDLGTVEPGVRETLADKGVLSYRVLSLDDQDPGNYPVDSLASISTHDLPTITGLWSGSDLEDQQRLDLNPPVEDVLAARQTFADVLELSATASLPDTVVRAHERLGRAASRLVLGQLEDAALVAERPNMPGTTDQWPNWSVALPEPLEVLLEDPLTISLASAMSLPVGTDPR